MVRLASPSSWWLGCRLDVAGWKRAGTAGGVVWGPKHGHLRHDGYGTNDLFTAQLGQMVDAGTVWLFLDLFFSGQSHTTHQANYM